MKIGGCGPRRTTSSKGPHKQTSRRDLLASKRRAEQRRALLRRGQPPRVMRSTRTTIRRESERSRSLFSALKRISRFA